MEFCECGSLIIGGNCTNRKCSKHTKKYEQISAKQIAIIKGLFEKLERDYSEADLKKMNTEDAQRLIYDLEDELEESKVRKVDPEEIDYEEGILEDTELDEEDDEEEDDE